MPGETDLKTLLRGLSPQLHPEPYLFVTVDPADLAGLAVVPRGLFREAEGVTLILERAAAAQAGFAAAEEWACITLQIHSSLSAVGMIAAVATALAEAGISCNTVAGYYHDHIFVPWEARAAAVAALERLSASV